MRRRLNFRVAAIIIIPLLVAGAAIHLVHHFQVASQTGVLLEQAARAEEQGDSAGATAYLERYLAMAPNDADALARFGLLVEKSARSNADRLRAFFALEKALRAGPERHDVRREVVRLAIALGRPGDARDHLNVLLGAFPDDAELEELQAHCAVAAAQFAEAADWYDRAIRHGPERVDCYLERARLLRRRLNRAQDADRLMDQLVAANQRSIPARLARARYFWENHSTEQAAADLTFAREELAADDREVLILSAEVALAQRLLGPARSYLQRGMELYPNDVSLCQAMARLELQAGQRAKAAEYLRRAAASPTDTPLSLFTTAELLIDAREYAEAKTVLERLGKGASPCFADYLNGRLRIADEDWVEARRLLERARQDPAAPSMLLRQANLLLAGCYQQLGNPDQQLAAARAALDIDPLSIPARMGVAAATAALGRTDAAARLYAQLADLTLAARLAAVRLMAAHNLHLPAAQRRWTDAERLLEDAPAALREDLDWRLARCELYFAQGKTDKAQECLEAAQQKYPDRVEIAVGRAALARSQPARAVAILDEAERALGDGPELRRARAALPLDKDSPALLRRLGTDLNGFSKTEQVRLLADLARRAGQAGDVRLAAEFAERVASLQPNNLEMLFLRFQLALRAGDAAETDKWLARLTAAEGEDGTTWRYAAAARRIRFAAPADRTAIDEARSRLAEAAKGRPSWALVPLLEAELYEREANFDGAIDKYRQAVALGDRQQQVIRRVVQLLHDRRRYGEAQEVLRHLQEETPLAGDLGRLATEVSLFNHQAPEQTLELARQAVSQTATNPKELLWLGQILTALKQNEEAERTLRRAAELGGDLPETWISLVSLLARTGKKDVAEVAIAQAEKKLPEKQAALALAVCWQAVGRSAQAERLFKAALANQPEDPTVARAVAMFYLRAGKPLEALPPLRKLVATSDSMRPWARRNLALALAATGDYAQFREALAIVEDNAKKPGAAVEDQRALALVLASRPNQRRASIHVLEESFAKLPATPEERFLLARLYEADQNWPKARSQFLNLVSSDAPNPLHLAHYVDALLRRREPQEAVHWLEKLEKLEAHSWRTVQARARLLVQQGRAAEATRIVKAYQGPEAGMPAAGLLEALGQKTAAEELFRQVAQASDRPEDLLVLAAFLGRNGKAAEALDLCDRAAGKSKPEVVAAVSVGLVRTGQLRPAQVERVEGLVVGALRKETKSLPLLLLLAELRDQQKRFAEVQDLYRQVLENDSKEPVANNNLAVLLALQGREAGRALELSQRAIDKAGPAPSLLDTRALAYLALGRHDQAIVDLEEVVALEPTASRYYHLARAYRAAKNAAAGQALQKAKALGLSAQVLHPLERGEYEKFAVD